MPRRLPLEFALPDVVAAQLREAEMAMQAKEAWVLARLRTPHGSPGKAAAILGISRHALFDLKLNLISEIAMRPLDAQSASAGELISSNPCPY